MDNLFAKIDDFETTLWVETAGLTVFLSVVFMLVTNIL